MQVICVLCGVNILVPIMSLNIPLCCLVTCLKVTSRILKMKFFFPFSIGRWSVGLLGFPRLSHLLAFVPCG